MGEHQTLSRTARHQKRRNTIRKLLFFSFLGVVFIIVLFSLIIFGNNEDNQTALDDPEQKEDIIENEQNENDQAETNEGMEENDVYELESDIEVEQVDSSDDNVIVAFTGDWPPIGTVQEGPHTTDYSNGSDDRIEIKRAVSVVTGIDEDNMREHWVGNGGDQKVIATVSDLNNEEFYRVYLSWIDQEGWQVTKVERIKEYVKQ